MSRCSDFGKGTHSILQINKQPVCITQYRISVTVQATKKSIGKQLLDIPFYCCEFKIIWRTPWPACYCSKYLFNATYKKYAFFFFTKPLFCASLESNYTSGQTFFLPLSRKEWQPVNSLSRINTAMKSQLFCLSTCCLFKNNSFFIYLKCSKQKQMYRFY